MTNDPDKLALLIPELRLERDRLMDDLAATKARLEVAKVALEAVVNHANKRQAIATAGRPMGDEELYRLEEPEFVERAREALAKLDAHATATGGKEAT